MNHVSGDARRGVAGVYNRAKYHPEKKAALEKWARQLASLKVLGWIKTRRRFGSGVRAYAYTRGEEPHKRICVTPGQDGFPATARYEDEEML